MRQIQRISPQQKIMSVNDRLGNRSIKKQQGTTRILYDSLPLDGRNNFEFFKGAQQRNIPFSNVGSFGNKLEVGETLAIERYYLTVLPIDSTNTVIDNPVVFNNHPELTGSELSVFLANNRIIKPIPVLSLIAAWNKSSQWSNDPAGSYKDHQIFEFDTQLVIPPLLEFTFLLEVPGVAPVEADFYLRLTIEGVGSIIAPRQTF